MVINWQKYFRFSQTIALKNAFYSRMQNTVTYFFCNCSGVNIQIFEWNEESGY